MDYIILFSNFFFFNSIKTTFFFFSLGLFLYLFFLSKSTFFQILITIVILTICGVLLASYGLDFFSGFLLLGELPILLVSFLFFFKKNKLIFDNLYSLKSSNTYYFFYLFFFIYLYLQFSYPNTYFISQYPLTLHTSVYIDYRNDFFNYYYIYYSIYPLFVVLLGFLIFIVSYLVIAVYYVQLTLQRKSNKNLLQFSFLRKQNFLKQSTFSTKLSFFKKTGFDK